MSWSTLFTLRAVVERSLSVNKAVFYAVNLSTQLWKEPMRAPGEENVNKAFASWKFYYAVTGQRSQSASAAIPFNVNIDCAIEPV